MNRNSFVFYKDWKEAMTGLPDSVRIELYDGIVEYATSGKVPELMPMARVAFNFVKTTIDRDIEKYDSIVEKKSTSGAIGNLKRWHKDLYKSVVSGEITIDEGIDIAKHRKHRKHRMCDNGVANIAVNEHVNVHVNDSKEKKYKQKKENSFSSSESDFSFSESDLSVQAEERIANWNCFMAKWQELCESGQVKAVMPEFSDFVPEFYTHNFELRLREYGLDGLFRAIDKIRASPFFKSRTLGLKTFLSEKTIPTLESGGYDWNPDEPKEKQPPNKPKTYALDEDAKRKQDAEYARLFGSRSEV